MCNFLSGQRLVLGMVLGICLGAAGCHSVECLAPAALPRELEKTTIPDYLIAPPDVLVLNMLRAVPIPPHHIEPLDLIFVHATNTPVEDPIKGVYRVDPEGTVRFGPAYGSVPIVGLTPPEAERAIEKLLLKTLKKTEVLVTVEQTRGVQQIIGEHLVRPDGAVSLGIYGRVRVAGMTQEQARAAMETHLAKFFVSPTVSLDVAGFNSHVYYVVFDGGGAGEQVIRLPYTGNDTVLDAIGQVYGLPAVASKHRIWIARPAPADSPCDQVLPVDWIGITQRGATATNYVLFPGDRVYVQAQPLAVVDTYLAKLLAPVERLFGIVLLGSSTVQSINNSNNNGTGSGTR
jgi:polysaccharide export outer membrane protein